METITNLLDAKVYVGTYSKYSNGSIFGKWLNLSAFSGKDEFLLACSEIHKDEKEPEFMFQDYKNIPDCLISESYISEKVFEILNSLSDLEDNEIDAFYAYLNLDIYDIYDIEKTDIDDLICNFRIAYMGKYKSKEDFSYKIVDSFYDLPKFAKTYFDYKAFSRDLFISKYQYVSGFVFRN